MTKPRSTNWPTVFAARAYYRREDAKDKKITMETYWIPGVNNSGKFGRWAFAEFTEVYAIESDFAAKVEAEFNRIIDKVASPVAAQTTA